MSFWQKPLSETIVQSKKLIGLKDIKKMHPHLLIRVHPIWHFSGGLDSKKPSHLNLLLIP